MNEALFFLHIAALIGFVLLALKVGRETLIACFGTLALLGNLFVTKQMVCFGLEVTCSDVYTIGALFSLNMLQEIYGKRAAKRAVWTVFFLLALFIVMAKLHMHYIPSGHDTVHGAFESVLSHSPRIMVTSLFVALIAQRLDVKLFGALKKFPLFLRFSLSSLSVQLLDTTLFSIIALWGIAHSIIDIICMSFAIKAIAIFTLAPFTKFAKRFAPHDPVQV